MSNVLLSFPHPEGNDHDRSLIANIARGDRAAFEELYLRYNRRIASFLRAISQSHELREEITNETFWIVWSSAGQFKGASKVSTWIMSIAHHVGLKTIRNLRRRLPSASSHVSTDRAAYEPWSQGELRELVAAALSHLPQEQRLVLDLAYRVGHSCEEIAEIVNCPVNTVKARMYQGRQKLKLLLPRLGGKRQDSSADFTRV